MKPGTLVKVLTVSDQPLGLIIHSVVTISRTPGIYKVRLFGDYNGKEYNFRSHQMEIINEDG